MEFEKQSIEEFVAEVRWKWETERLIDSDKIPKLIEIANRHKSTPRIEAENEWLRKRIDELTV